MSLYHPPLLKPLLSFFPSWPSSFPSLVTPAFAHDTIGGRGKWEAALGDHREQQGGLSRLCSCCLPMFKSQFKELGFVMFPLSVPKERQPPPPLVPIVLVQTSVVAFGALCCYPVLWSLPTGWWMLKEQGLVTDLSLQTNPVLGPYTICVP